MLFLREAASTQDPRMGYSSGFRNLKNMLFCFYRYNILTDHLSLFTLALGKLRAKLQGRSAKIYYLIAGLIFLFPCLPLSGFFTFLGGYPCLKGRTIGRKTKQDRRMKGRKRGREKKRNATKRYYLSSHLSPHWFQKFVSIIIRLSI